MNAEATREVLIEVIAEIQKDSGVDPPEITDDLRPASDLEEFDSLVWPAATAVLAERLHVNIPDNENLFVSSDCRKFYTVREIIARIIKLANGGSK